MGGFVSGLVDTVTKGKSPIDALKDAGKSILQNPGGAGVDIFGTNVPLWPLVSYRDHFLRVLETWSGSIPNQFQWLVLIDHFPVPLYTDLLQELEHTDGEKKGWNIARNVETVTNPIYQRIAGCVFAQGVNIPGENLQVAYAKPSKNRGFLGTLYSGDRADLAPLTIQFLETNTSFADFVIRPWILLASHLGMVARPGDGPGSRSPLNIKTDITVIQLGKTFQKRSSVTRKMWRYYNCVPFSVSNGNLPYNTTATQTYDTQWQYSHYSVEGLPYIPLDSIIKKFSLGQAFNIFNAGQQLGLFGKGNSAQAQVDSARKASQQHGASLKGQATSIASGKQQKYKSVRQRGDNKISNRP